MVEFGEADAFISGLTKKYADTMRPLLHVLGKTPGVKRTAGMYIMLTKKGPYFFSDTSVNINPDAEDIVDITVSTAKAVQRFGVRPSVALLSYSNFGSNSGELPDKMQNALSILHENYPGLIVDGEMQANIALNHELLKENFPFSELVQNPPNTLIFPELSSANIAYKMMQSFDAAEAIGPILLGINKPAHILQLGSSVREIVNMVILAVVDAQTRS
jgi:malate dehydrogenase (oxaloacetate-decarboxylating)(NADP+)